MSLHKYKRPKSPDFVKTQNKGTMWEGIHLNIAREREYQILSQSFGFGLDLVLRLSGHFKRISIFKELVNMTVDFVLIISLPSCRVILSFSGILKSN